MSSITNIFGRHRGEFGLNPRTIQGGTDISDVVKKSNLTRLDKAIHRVSEDKVQKAYALGYKHGTMRIRAYGPRYRDEDRCKAYMEGYEAGKKV